MPDLVGGLGDKITAAVHAALDALPGIEAPVLQTIKDSVASVIAAETAGIVQIGDTLLRVEQPVLDESKAWREQLALGFEGSISGIPFVIRGIKPATKQV